MLKGQINTATGRKFTVTITEKDKKVREMAFTDNPIIIERVGEDDGIFSPIISTSCTLRLLCDSNYQYDFLATDDYPHHVIVADGFNTLFVGPIEKGLHKEAYDMPPFVTEVVAGCGIKNLKNWTPYFPELTDDFRGAKRITLKELIESCLTVAGDHMKPQFDTSKLEYWQDDLDATFDAREWLYDGGIRDTTTAYDVLTAILTTMGARCYQHNGNWYIDRPGDLLQRSHREISVDNDKVYFIDNANSSISKACGVMNITMPLKTKKNIISSRPDAIDDPNGWHIVNTGGNITRASADGYDIHISAHEKNYKIQGVECHYKVPFKTLIENSNFNQIRLSAKFFSPNTNEADRCTAKIYMYPVIMNKEGRVTFVPIPTSPKITMVSINTTAGALFGGTGFYTQFENLQKKGGAQVQQNIYFDRDELLRGGDADYLKLVYDYSFNTHQEGPNYNVDKFTVLEDLEIGDIALTLGREFEEEDNENELKLFVRCKEADESLAEEVEVGFAVDGPICDIGMMVNRTLMKLGHPVSTITKRGTSVGVDPLALLACDRALQNSCKREVIDATLNSSTLYAPFEIIRVAAQKKTYLATSQHADLMNETNEVTLTELVNDTVKIISRS